jgi:hypothetical protein
MGSAELNFSNFVKLNGTHETLTAFEISGTHGNGMKLAVFWVVVLCSLVEVYRRFRGAYCLHRPDDVGRKHL